MYSEAINPTLLARQREARQAEIAQEAKEHPVFSSIQSVAATPLKSAGYLYGLGAGLIGKEVDPNDPRFIVGVAQQEIRGAVGEEIKESIKSKPIGDAASFLYSTGMSIADFLLVGGTTGGGAAGLAIMGTGAASDATMSAFDRGATQEQALAAGFWAGTAEVIFEKISLEHFIKLTNPAVRGALAKNALKQAGIEASEELLTEIANRVSDDFVMKDLSEYNLAVQGYLAQGLSEVKAKKQANRDFAGQVGLAALGGAISGGTTGTVGGAIGDIRNTIAEHNAQQAVPDPAIQAAPGLIEANPTDVTQEGIAAPAEAADAATTWQQAVSPEAIAANKAALRDMPAVTSISGQEFQKGPVGLVEQVSQSFASLGNKVLNPKLGEVELTRRGIRDSMGHGIGKVKAAAFAAVPSVIENGAVIDYQENWKGRRYDTIVIAAPVEIDGEKSYVGAVLQKDAESQRYYLHEVLQEKGPLATFKTGSANNGQLPGDARRPLILSLLKESLAVNTPKAADKQDFSGNSNQADTPFFLGAVVPPEARPAGPIPLPVAPSAAQSNPKNIWIPPIGPPQQSGGAPAVGSPAGPSSAQGRQVILPPGVIPEQVNKLGAKAAAYKRSHEAAFVETMAEVLQIPDSEMGEARPYLSDLGMKAIQTGEMSEADKQTLFKQMYWGGAEEGTRAYNDAYLQYENSLFDLRKQLNLAQRHEASKLAKLNRKAELKRQAAETLAVVTAYTRQAGLRKAMEKASGMLTDGDKSFAAAMINGPADLSQVQDKTLRAQIETYAATRKAYDENRTVIDEYNKQRRARLFKEATNAISDSDQ